ncbi:MAG: pseudouridine synthase [Robiginitomaculum sp.]
MLRPFAYTPADTPLRYIYKDDHFLIVDKPTGLLSVPGKSGNHKDCLELRVQKDYPPARIIHRLDMATSGIMVMAMHKDALRHIGLQFERRYVQKTYIAKIWGKPEKNKGEINLPLICDWPNRPLQKVDFEVGKSALTHWEIIGSEEQTSRVLLTPKTGRSHQLRVHMNELGHPIIGDTLYAHDVAFKAADRLMLHAQSLEFHHPDGGKRVCFEIKCEF